MPIMMKVNELLEKIAALKAQKDAVILAHYYVLPEIQEIADFTGDSFFLAKKATELPNRTIVFAGVNFMGESAKMLNPSKTVLLPDMSADCPMAHMVTKEYVDKVRAECSDLAVVCYINSTAEIKSWSDVCVTSSNAVKVVRNLEQKNILFIPDRNLGRYVASLVPEKTFILNNGYCPRHEFMDAGEILELKRSHPDAVVLVHPECNEEVTGLADYIGSTKEIIEYAGKSDRKEFIIGTEVGVEYELTERRPDAEFHFTRTRPVCTNMKKNSLEKILHVLETGENEVSLPPEGIRSAAERTLVRMLEMAK